MTQFLLHIPLFPLVLYSICIIIFIVVSLLKKQTDTKNTGSEVKNISIIIPFRNEAKHIKALMKSLALLKHEGNLEVLLIDDDSSDDSTAQIDKYHYLLPFPVRQIAGTYNKQIPLTRKQQALDLGIRKSRYDHIAFTDADMQLHPDWVSSLDRAMTPEISLVYGHSVITPVKTFLSWLQAMQLEFLFAVAAVFELIGIVGSCMGNNLLLNKNAYNKTGGFKSIGYTITEDRALLRHFRKNGCKTALALPFSPTAATAPHVSFPEFIQQQLRWAKGGFGNGINLLLFGLLFMMEIISVPITLVGCTGLPFMYLSVGNLLLTWLFIFVSFHRNHSKVSPVSFIFFYPFLLIEAIILPLLLLFPKKTNWKETPV